MECKKERNMGMCTCTFSCSKKGTCCDCVKYHRDQGELPGCYFSREAEATGDRSVEAFLRDRDA